MGSALRGSSRQFAAPNGIIEERSRPAAASRAAPALAGSIGVAGEHLLTLVNGPVIALPPLCVPLEPAAYGERSLTLRLHRTNLARVSQENPFNTTLQHPSWMWRDRPRGAPHKSPTQGGGAPRRYCKANDVDSIARPVGQPCLHPPTERVR